jgi:hypothetical protein
MGLLWKAVKQGRSRNVFAKLLSRTSSFSFQLAIINRQDTHRIRLVELSVFEASDTKKLFCLNDRRLLNDSRCCYITGGDSSIVVLVALVGGDISFEFFGIYYLVSFRFNIFSLFWFRS